MITNDQPRLDVEADQLAAPEGAAARPAAARRTHALRLIRAALTGFLLIAAFALSFGALRNQATEAAIIHGALGTMLFGGLSAHTLAGIWALCPDVLAVVGIVGIRIDRRDPRAWAALVLGLAMTLTFQVWDEPWAPLLRGVPAAAGAMAVWILEVPWTRPVARPDWPIPTPPVQPDPVPDPEPVPEARPRDAQDVTHTRGRPATRGRPFTPADHPKVEAWIGGGRTNKKAMADELGLHHRGYLDLGRYVNQYRDQPVPVGRNGDGS